MNNLPILSSRIEHFNTIYFVQNEKKSGNLHRMNNKDAIENNSPQPIRRIDHIGHAVTDIKKATDYYINTLGYAVICEEDVPDHGVKLVFLALTDGNPAAQANFPTIELLSPTVANTPLARFLAKRGEGLHHICYRVDSVSAELARLKAQGMPLIDLEPRKGSRDLWIAFLHPKGNFGVLVELCSEQQ